MVMILAAAFLAVAVVFSMMGQGGGVLYTPIQVWLGVDFHTAATTSLFLIMVLSLSSTLVFRKAKKTDWGLALVLESSTMAGGFTGGFVSAYVAGAVLSGVFAGVIFLAAWFMIRPGRRRVLCGEGTGGFFSWKRALGAETFCVNLAVALPVSFAAGLLSGLVGVGGGILKVPMLVLLFGIPMDIAVGSSAFMVGLTAAAGFGGHVIHGHWDWKTSMILAVVVFAGGQIGSRVTLGIDKARLKKAFGWFLVGVGLLMLVRMI